jgi:DNA helicase IV
LSTASVEISLEQDHYDAALDAREDHRSRIGSAAGAAARPQDAREIRAEALRMQEAMPSKEKPAFFARVDLEPKGGGAPQARYLGLCAVHDDNQKLLVMNFRMPAAECYYKATPDNPMGMLRKRTFEVEDHRVLSYEEVVLEELEKDLEALEKALQGPGDALLRDLEASRDGSMREIAQTIGAAQYDLITRPIEGLLVVQGGPGTGKTAVALHRISYWLYNTRDLEDPASRLTPQDVLVVGPSQAFTKYIGRVLPDLGDGEVAYEHLRNLGPQRSSTRPEPVRLAALKGDSRMAGLLERAARNRIRIPAGRLEIGPPGAQRWVTAEAVESRVSELRDLPYRTGRREFSDWLTRETAAPGRPFTADQITAAVERVWPLSTSPRFLQELLASQNMLLSAAGDEFTAAEIQSLYRQAAPRITEETWSDADVALIDEIESLMEGRSATYKHIVVDEAQDLSDMQLRSLRRRSLNGSMTIVGDLAQSTGPFARQNWKGIMEGLAQEHTADLVELELGYRVPRQIFDFAAQLLPFAAPGITVPQVIRSGPSDPELLEHDIDDVADAAVAAAAGHAGRGAFVGIVCPATLRDSLVAALTKRSIKWADGDGGLNANLSSINMVSPQTAKGLEFDAVVVVEPEAIVASDPHGLRLLYIALTRTTSHLTVAHSGRALPLPREDDIADPQAAVADTQIIPGPPPHAVQPSLEPTAPKLPEPLPEPEPTPAKAAVSDTQPVPPSTVEPTATATQSPRPQIVQTPLDLSGTVVRAAVAGISSEVRNAVPQAQWVRLIDELRKELGITDEQLFDLLE